MALLPFLGSLRLSIVRTAPEPLCRVLMAASGLALLELDPPDFSVAPSAITPLLLGYLAFAAWLLARECRDRPPLAHVAWADLAWCLALTAASGGTSSVLFFFLLLPIMSHAFRDGYSAGWTMTWVTTAGYLAVGLPSSRPPGGRPRWTDQRGAEQHPPPHRFALGTACAAE